MTRPKDRVPDPDLDLVVLEVLLHALPDAVETECRDIVFLFACENLNCGSGRDTEKGCTRHCTHSGLGDGVLGRPGGLTRPRVAPGRRRTRQSFRACLFLPVGWTEDPFAAQANPLLSTVCMHRLVLLSASSAAPRWLQAPKQPGVDGEITTGQVAARRDGYDPGNIVTCVQTTVRALGHHSFPVPSPSRPRTHENQKRTGTTQPCRPCSWPPVDSCERDVGLY